MFCPADETLTPPHLYSLEGGEIFAGGGQCMVGIPLTANETETRLMEVSADSDGEGEAANHNLWPPNATHTKFACVHVHTLGS